jgi:hypothetical protein
MALASFGDLQSAVANWLNRSDIAVHIDTMIDLGSRRIRREQEWDQRIYSMELSNGVPNGALSVTQQGQILPAKVRIIKTLWPTAGTDMRPLEQTTFDELRTRAAGNFDATGTPRMFALVPTGDPSTAGPRLFLWPQPSGAYTIDFLYVNDPGDITAQNVTALFTYAPDVYIFAALAESAPFLKHDERVPMWERKYLVALASLNSEPMRQAAGATLQRAKLRPIG